MIKRDTLFYPFDDKWETYFIIPNQTVVANPPNQICKFPIEYNEGRIDSFSTMRIIKAITNRPQFNLNHAKLDMQQRTTQIIKPVGSGRINVNFFPSNLEVVLYSCLTITERMLYVDGALAPREIADSIGIGSERIDTVYSYCFYAKGYPGEILRFNRITGPFGTYTWCSLLRKLNVTGIEKTMNQTGLKVTPQPSNNGIFDIKFNKSELLPYQINVFDAMGNTIYSSAIKSNIGEVNYRIDLSNQPSGSYFIKISSETGMVLFTDKALVVK